MRGYTWKVVPEIAWTAFVAAFIVVVTAVAFDEFPPTDWEQWAVALGGGAARAAAAAIAAALTGGSFER